MSEQDKSTYIISSTEAEASIEIQDAHKRMSFLLSTEFGKLKYDGKTYEISQAGAKFVIKLPGKTNEAIIDITPVLKAAVAALAAFE